MSLINIDEDRNEIKKLLGDDNKWGVYWELRRKGLREGLSMKEAHAKALEGAKADKSDGGKKVQTEEVDGSFTKEEQELFDSLNAGARKANIREIIEWIYNNIGNKNINPLTAPNQGSYCHLRKIQADPILQAEFYKNIWPKIMPKADMMEELIKRFNDDGGEEIGVIDKILAAINQIPQG